MSTSRKIYRLALSVAGLLCASLTVSGTAIALETRTPIEPSLGPFGRAVGVTVDQSNGNVYVVDGEGANDVRVYGREGGAPVGGGPSSFTGAKTPSRTFSIEQMPSDAAAFEGRVYIPDPGHNLVDEFALNGSHEYEYLCEITSTGVTGNACSSTGAPGTGFNEPVAAALDSAGDLYISDRNGRSIDEFNPAGEQIRTFPTGTFPTGSEPPEYLAVATDGTIYVTTRGGRLFELKRSSPTGEVEGEPELILEGAKGVAYDRKTEILLVNVERAFPKKEWVIEELDASHKVIRTFGEGVIGYSQEIAVEEATDHVYVVNEVEGYVGRQVVRFGPLIVRPDEVTGGASNVAGTSVTLHGTVNPDRTNVTGCRFEYGVTAYYTSIVPCASNPGSGEAPVPVSADLSGLAYGTVYHYRLVAENSNGTSYGADMTTTTLTSKPIVTGAVSASSVTGETAVIAGLVLNSGGLPTGYHYEYGTTSAYGSSTPELSAGSGGEEQPLAPQYIEGLAPGTVYHYRLVAANGEGTVDTPDATFTTASPTPPLAITGGAGSVAQTTATIAGTVDPQGLSTTYGFQLGTSAGYTQQLAAGGFATGTMGEQPVALALAYLAPNTTYHYRVFAVNQDGTSYGADQTFTTKAYINPLAIPIAPPLLAGSTIAFPTETKPVKHKPKHKTKRKDKRKKSRLAR